MDFKENQIGSEEQRIVLRTLAESVATPGCRLLEIGSWCGDSSVVLGKIAKQNGGHLFCVDWWMGSEGTYQEEIAHKGDVFAFFWDQIRSEGLEDIVIPIRGRSDISSKIFKENIFDMIFIDGDHRYKNTLKDIQQYSAFVKDKGVLCGHDCEGRISDYDMNFLQSGKRIDAYESVHCGVVLAVGSIFNQFSLNYSIWSVRASGNNGGWEPTNLEFPGLKDKKQLPPPPIGISNNYGIFRFGKQVYAIPRSFDSLDVTEEKVHSHSEVVVANSLVEMEGLINETVSCAEFPELLESYKDYNLVTFKDRIYAIAQSLGEFDLMRVEEPQLKEYQERDECIIGDGIDDVKKLIDHQRWRELYELLEDYKGFNIVLYKGEFFALSQTLGEIDLAKEDDQNLKKYQEHHECLVGNSLTEIKQLVDQLLYRTLKVETKEMEKKMNALRGVSISSAPTPIFLDSYKGYNFVQYRDSIYALSQSLGEIDLSIEDSQNLRKYQNDNTCIITGSLYEAKFLISQILHQTPRKKFGELEDIKSSKIFRAINWIKRIIK